MKIVKLGKGYRIRVTDTEFTALHEITIHGLEHVHSKDIQKGLPGRVKSMINSTRFDIPGGPLAQIDETKGAEEA